MCTTLRSSSRPPSVGKRAPFATSFFSFRFLFGQSRLTPILFEHVSLGSERTLARSGQVVGAAILEDAVLNHKNLDSDVSFFISRPSTLENVCLFAWRNIGVIIAHTPRQVYEVSVEAEPCPRTDALSIEKTRVTFSGQSLACPHSHSRVGESGH